MNRWRYAWQESRGVVVDHLRGLVTAGIALVIALVATVLLETRHDAAVLLVASIGEASVLVGLPTLYFLRLVVIGRRVLAERRVAELQAELNAAQLQLDDPNRPPPGIDQLTWLNVRPTLLPPAPPSVEILPSGSVVLSWTTRSAVPGTETACEVRSPDGDEVRSPRWERTWPTPAQGTRLTAVWPDEFVSDPPGMATRRGRFDVWWRVRGQQQPRLTDDTPVTYRYSSVEGQAEMLYDPPGHPPTP